MHREICPKCGAIHRVYPGQKSWKTCRKIVDISDEGGIIKCGAELVPAENKQEENRPRKKCSVCGKLGHNKRTCPNVGKTVKD